MRQRLDRADGQHLTERESEVGGFPHLGHCAREERRHSLAADVGAGRHGVPAGVNELPVGQREAVGRGDASVFPAASLTVAGRVQRCQHFSGKASSLRQDRLDNIRLRVFKSRQGGYLRQSSETVEDEAHLLQGGRVGHAAASPMVLRRSRKSTFCTLPVAFFGIGPNTTSLGTLYPAI